MRPAARPALLIAAGLLLGLAPGMPIPAQAAGLAADRTAATAAVTNSEEAKVDAVAAPKLTWHKKVYTSDGTPISYYASTAKLPLDYDKPKGATVTVALAKLPATGSQKLGTLFVNPGGPDGSATQLAYYAENWLSADVRAKYDVVGIDPRGTNSSQQVRCFAKAKDSLKVATALNVVPITSKQQKTYLAAAKKLAQACSGHGKTLASSMSTAEVVRDMDVLRRSVGDAKLHYLGFSYGTYIGEVYANMFPDRVGAMVIDGVLNPTQWLGSTTAAATTSLEVRVKTDEASWAALQALFARCTAAGSDYCSLADPAATFARVMKKYRSDTDSYNLLLALAYQAVEAPSDEWLAQYFELLGKLDPGAVDTSALSGSAANTYLRSFARAYATKYYNDTEAYSSVVCTDAREPAKQSDWTAQVKKAKADVPYFGEYVAWGDAQCATQYWKARDEDRYVGAFTATTANPVLIVGDYHDPTTSYNGAVAVHALLPNSYLVRSDSWGHTAYGTSDCVTDKVDAYLLTLTEPSDTVCTGDFQPFTTKLDTFTTKSYTPSSTSTASRSSGASVLQGILGSRPVRFQP